MLSCLASTQESKAKSILLVDDHPIIRFGFATLLAQEDSQFVFHEASTANEALAIATDRVIDLALVDLSLAGELSLDLIKRLRGISPKTSILVVSMHDEKLYAERVLRAGARGYVMKQSAAKTINLAARHVLEGRIWLSPEMKSNMMIRIADNAPVDTNAAMLSLSDREANVFALIGKGMKKSEIAKHLHISPHTVETYRGNIKQKLGLSSGAELYQRAFMHARGERADD